MVYLFDNKVILISAMLYVIIIVFLKLFLKRNLAFYIFFTLMYIYVNIVIKYTQFPIYNDEFQKSILGPFSIEKNFNFIPFRNFFNLSSLYNIIMVVPFGFLLPLVVKINLIKVFLTGLGFSCILECIQALVGMTVGYSTRIIDVNDLICNALGAIIGYGVFIIFRTIIKKIWGDKQTKDFFLSYIILETKYTKNNNDRI